MANIESIKKQLKGINDDLGKEKIENIGVLDLRDWESRITRLQFDNSRLIDEARYDVDVDNDELRQLFKDSDALWEEMQQALATIATVLEGKENQILELDAEIAKQKAIINMYLRKKEIYVDMTTEDNQMIGSEETDPELSKLCNAELEAELKKIDKIEELIQRHKEICYGYNAIISVLRNGGEIKKQKATSKAKEEEPEKPVAEAKKDDMDAAFANGVNGKLLDGVFANGVSRNLLDKAFANGSEQYVGLAGTDTPEAKELDEDADIAEINIPHFEGQSDAHEEVIHMVMDDTVGETPTEEVEDDLVEDTKPALEAVSEVVEEETEALAETVDETPAETLEGQPEFVAETVESGQSVVLDNPVAGTQVVAQPTAVVLDTPQPAATVAPSGQPEIINWSEYFDNFDNNKEVQRAA